MLREPGWWETPHLLPSPHISDACLSCRAGCDSRAGGARYVKLQGAEREREGWSPWLCRRGGAGATDSQESLDSLAVELHPSTAVPQRGKEVGVEGGSPQWMGELQGMSAAC